MMVLIIVVGRDFVVALRVGIVRTDH